MISLESLETMPEKVLIDIYRTLNHWNWCYLLGAKPDDWDDLPNYKKPHMNESVKTKEDYIRPYMRKIRGLISYTQSKGY